MKKLLKSLICLLALCLASPALAGTIREYSADMVNVENGSVTQRMAVTPDKIMMEIFDEDGQQEAKTIVRLDQRKMYIFSPDKTYMEIPFERDSFNFLDLGMGMMTITSQEKMGVETISGYKAEKIQITANVMGMTTTTFTQWIAKEFEPMPIRMDSDGSIMEMRNIKAGSQNSSLFDIPTGYTRNIMMEEMVKGLLGLGGDSNAMGDIMKGLMDAFKE